MFIIQLFTKHKTKKIIPSRQPELPQQSKTIPMLNYHLDYIHHSRDVLISKFKYLQNKTKIKIIHFYSILFDAAESLGIP